MVQLTCVDAWHSEEAHQRQQQHRLHHRGHHRSLRRGTCPETHTVTHYRTTHSLPPSHTPFLPISPHNSTRKNRDLFLLPDSKNDSRKHKIHSYTRLGSSRLVWGCGGTRCCSVLAPPRLLTAESRFVSIKEGRRRRKRRMNEITKFAAPE